MPCLAMLTFAGRLRWDFSIITFPLVCPSLVWQLFASRGAERLLALALVPLIWMAHPLGLFWFVGAAGYITLARTLSGRGQIFLLALAAVSLTILGDTCPFIFHQGGRQSRV